jgi:hypothetical protein
MYSAKCSLYVVAALLVLTLSAIHFVSGRLSIGVGTLSPTIQLASLTPGGSTLTERVAYPVEVCRGVTR